MNSSLRRLYVVKSRPTLHQKRHFHRPAANRPIHFIFGANTDVGKTVISAGLVRATTSMDHSDRGKNITTNYIKPLQCGGSDQRFIEKHTADVASLTTQTLFVWDTPASPHVAARKENKPVSDEQVIVALQDCLSNIYPPDLDRSSKDDNDLTNMDFTWIETAGGVLSPSSSSPENKSPKHAIDASETSWGWVTQGDLYQSFLDYGSVVLIGDGRLGGISATLSSLESLLLRGYTVSGLILLETGHSNRQALVEYAKCQVKQLAAEGDVLYDNPDKSIISLPALPPEPEPLFEWYNSPEVHGPLEEFVGDHLVATWRDRCESYDIHH